MAGLWMLPETRQIPSLMVVHRIFIIMVLLRELISTVARKISRAAGKLTQQISLPGASRLLRKEVRQLAAIFVPEAR